MISNQQAGRPTLAIYALDNEGRISLTNFISVTVSVSGFTEIHPGSLAAVFDSSTSLGDVDGDGDPDLILTGANGDPFTSRIYRNNWNRGGYVPYTVP